MSYTLTFCEAFKALNSITYFQVIQLWQFSGKAFKDTLTDVKIFELYEIFDKIWVECVEWMLANDKTFYSF
jgi:hypothetical protein